ncbi:glycoside hydrolase family 4 [Victivallis lenta]|uniref:family 4 glycosyl hydrolase n=1 Tax=Victivallis lenta TaxID=2606640 RepID=UPI003AB5F58A
MPRSPKIVVLGAGSYFFGKPVIYNMMTSPILRNGTLALVDTDPAVLATMMRLAERAKAHSGAPVELTGSVNRLDVLEDADFVVLSFSYRNAHYREIDTRISRKYGVTMCSSDTIGPGGIFRALRELPEILQVAEDVKRHAPNAWLINFINPTAVNGIALMRHAPEVKSFALCDGLHEPYIRLLYLKQLGILPPEATVLPPEIDEKFDLVISGVNHCTWMLRCRYDGRDCLPAFHEFIRREAAREYESRPSDKAKPRLNMNYALELFDLYGAFPTAVSHTKEYVPFYQGCGVTPNTPEPIIPFDGYNRADEMAEAWAATEALADGKTPIEQFFETGHGDHATDIIESMWGKLGKPFYINTANRGAVPNLPDDAFLELRCDLDLEGPKPRPACALPRGILGLTGQVLDTHELTVEAAVHCDRRLLLRALATDPIVNNLGDARAIMNELLEAEKEHLDPRWF